MVIAFASGKGGTGKTTLSTSMAKAVEGPITYLDCDVEEPNGHIFLKPIFNKKQDVNVLVPEVDESLCKSCGKCSKFCQFNAIIVLGNSKAMVFPELCHSCGGCERICPDNAIREIEKSIGSIEIGKKDNINFIHGKLDIGKAMSPPVIRVIKSYIKESDLTIVDCPPGTACSMVTAVSGSDYIVLVTEPTPFGLHDLKLAVETVRLLNIPFGVAINRCDIGNDCVVKYCINENIKIVIEIPNKRVIAESYSRGELFMISMPSVKEDLLKIIEIAKSEINSFKQSKV